MQSYSYTVIFTEAMRDAGRLDIPVSFREAFNVKFAYMAKFNINGSDYETYITAVGGDMYTMRKNLTLVNKFSVGEQLNIKIEPCDPIFYVDGGYSYDAPIRALDSVDALDYVRQPTGYLCGQACVAMLAGRPVDEVCKIINNEKGTNIEHIKAALEYYGIRHAKALTKYKADMTQDRLPEICILLLQLPAYTHWTLYFKGKFYDPEFGVIDGFSPESAPLRYLTVYAK